MVAPARAVLGPAAFRQLIFGVLAHVVSTALFLVARLAEVSVAPAKPLGDRTAKFTLELNKVFAVLETVLNRDFAAVRAHQLFCFERTLVPGIVHGLCTVLPAPKVGVLAFEALEVGIDGHRVFIGLFKVGRFGVDQLLILFAFLEFQPFKGHALQLCKQV